MDSWELVEFAREAGLLAEHDRQVAERAWDECIRAIEWAGRHGEDPLAYGYANSPYRAAKGEPPEDDEAWLGVVNNWPLRGDEE